jgi:hypothetical protein
VNIISVFLRLFNLSSGVSLDCGQRGNIRITFISLMCEVRKNLNRQKDFYVFQMGRSYVRINLSGLDITMS